ncbi:MAG: hypothetical protein ACYSUV_05795 [Planctomycetota bacterium]|jgi:hypothetical protein
MAAKRITIHCLEIEDKPGSLYKFLSDAAHANVDMLCLTAFSMGFGRGRVCVSAKDPEALKSFAGESGIDVTTEAGFMVSGENGVAGAAMVCDGHYQLLVVVGAGDADAAARALGV